MSDLDHLFNFKIGEFVQTKTPLATVKRAGRRGDERKAPVLGMPMLVVSRFLEECPGGVQKHYQCRVAHLQTLKTDGAEYPTINARVVASPSLELHRANEVELELFDPDGYNTAIAAEED